MGGYPGYDRGQKGRVGLHLHNSLPVLPPDIDQKFWIPKYDEIVELLGLNPEEDRKATRFIHDQFLGKKTHISGILYDLLGRIRSKFVTIFGCGPSLDDQISIIGPHLGSVSKIAADGATTALLESELMPDVIITDLDGYVPDIIECSKKGAIVLLHAHGDNREAVESWLPDLETVIPLTQTEPTEIVRNYGGFTDGDKCLFLASAF